MRLECTICILIHFKCSQFTFAMWILQDESRIYCDATGMMEHFPINQKYWRDVVLPHVLKIQFPYVRSNAVDHTQHRFQAGQFRVQFQHKFKWDFDDVVISIFCFQNPLFWICPLLSNTNSTDEISILHFCEIPFSSVESMLYRRIYKFVFGAVAANSSSREYYFHWILIWLNK